MRLCSEGQQTVACESNPPLHLFLQIKCHWNTATLIHLCIVCFSFLSLCDPTAELRDCDGDHIDHEA